jgi:hypothetical protein
VFLNNNVKQLNERNIISPTTYKFVDNQEKMNNLISSSCYFRKKDRLVTEFSKSNERNMNQFLSMDHMEAVFSVQPKWMSFLFNAQVAQGAYTRKIIGEVK